MPVRLCVRNAGIIKVIEIAESKAEKLECSLIHNADKCRPNST